jgi:anti-sigma factor RsiW
MNSNFGSYNNDPRSQADARSAGPETIQRDRFELLSAYLDGEVTAAERRQVEEWLTTDPTVQRLHSRLLKLRQGFQSLPVPVPEQSVQHTVDQVFNRVERRPRLRLIWGGAAIAAAAAAALLTGLPLGRGPVPQMAERPQTPPSTAVTSEPLMIALDKPLVPLSKASVAAPVSPLRSGNQTVR